MGRDKSQLRLGSRTMPGHLRSEVKKLGLPVRVIRRDIVVRCGPLGGVYTALKSTRADAVMFLPCDMPFITANLLRFVHQRFGRGKQSLFVCLDGKMGFPFVLRHDALQVVTRQIAEKKLSLHELARTLKVNTVPVPARWRLQLHNVNTPAEWKRAIAIWQAVREV